MTDKEINKRLKRVKSNHFISLLGLVTFLFANSQPRVVRAEADKPPMAVVNVQRVIDQSELGKGARAAVEAVARKHKTELSQLKTQLDSFRSQIANQAKLVTGEALEEKQRELAKRERDFERVMKDRQEELVRLNQEKIKGVVEKIDKVVNQVASSRKMKFIFEREPGFLVYYNSTLDITDNVIESVNSAYGS
jgi:outer membrane protein